MDQDARLRIPDWRRRLPFYLLMAIGVLLFVQFLEQRPREVELYFVLTSLTIPTDGGRLDRADLVELMAEVRDGEDRLAETTWRFRRGAPLKVGPARVRLKPGAYDVHYRLRFAPGDGDERLFALRSRLVVTTADAPILLDVTSDGAG